MKGEKIDNLLAKKILGLLLKEPMSQSDLAYKIYCNRNIRSGISKWVNIFLKEGLITKREINSKSVLYKAKPEILGEFDNQELKFIEIIIERFWNPIKVDSFENLTELIIQSLTIKKIFKLKGSINGYNFSRELSHYNKNKKLFWKDKKVRDSFFNKLSKKGDKRNRKLNIRKDYLFFSLLTPNNISNRLDSFKKSLGNPMFINLKLLTD